MVNDHVSLHNDVGAAMTEEDDHNAKRELWKSVVQEAVRDGLRQLCGGGILVGKEQDDDVPICIIDLEPLVAGSVVFPGGSKSHDMEVRAALTLYNRYHHLNKKSKNQRDACIGAKRRRRRGDSETSINGETCKGQSTEKGLEMVSDMGLVRSVGSALELADCLANCMEQHATLRRVVGSHVRSNPCGMICIVSHERVKELFSQGDLPCPYCTKWCKGEKGLWWHQQQQHGSQHSDAASQAAISANSHTLALVPYNPIPFENSVQTQTKHPTSSTNSSDQKDEMEMVKEGYLEGLKQAIANGYDPKVELDRNGASVLLWAAGCGHLQIVRFLVETCGCDANQKQSGKRSFAGRTTLHWAARNGHLDVVQYLVDVVKVNLDASTVDGTTAFCWACWQGHFSILRFLHDRGCDVHRLNSFGCNAMLWCAQGSGNCSLEIMQWLHEIVGVALYLVNSNNHGVLHKAAQRGNEDVCKWFVSSTLCATTGISQQTMLSLIGPDSDICCPSDLAGMAGHQDLAEWIANQEENIVKQTIGSLIQKDDMMFQQHHGLPTWLQNGMDKFPSTTCNIHAERVWESQGGVRRMSSLIVAEQNIPKTY